MSCFRVNGAPRSVKFGTIRSPCRYDATTGLAFRLHPAGGMEDIADGPAEAWGANAWEIGAH
jgi:hypothetical protein